MIIQGHCVVEMDKMNASSVDMVLHSSPFYRLRFYHTEYQVWGGDKRCKHQWEEYVDKMVQKAGGSPLAFCKHCGAWKGELGWEPNPRLFVNHLFDASVAVRRVLKDTGTYWVNLGDTFEDNSLQLVPDRYVIMMKDAGWYVRNFIIWHKTRVFGNPVKSRFIQDWEPWFFFAKQPNGYYFDQDIVRLGRKMTKDQVEKMSIHKVKNNRYAGDTIAPGTILAGSRPISKAYGSIKEIKGANRRCVWTIAAAEAEEGHYAPFPREIVEICVKAGCPAGGTVLDPFSGTGTTVEVANHLGRKGIGIELSAEHAKKAMLKATSSRSFDFDRINSFEG